MTIDAYGQNRNRAVFPPSLSLRPLRICHRSVLFALIERLKAEVGVLELHVAYLRPDIAEKFA
jgi:hypothetical protein